MTFVLSVDPGGESGVGASGWCYQDENKVYAMESVQNLREFLVKWDLKKLPVDHVVVEGYFIPPTKKGVQSNVGRKLPVVENIGVVKLWAEMNGLKWTEYMPAIKPQQCKLTQIFPKKMPKAIEHKFDAFNHGRFYLIQNHGAPTALEQKMKAEGKL